MDAPDPQCLAQLITVSGLHDQRLETLAARVEDLTAQLARATQRVQALEAQVAGLETTLRQGTSAVARSPHGKP